MTVLVTGGLGFIGVKVVLQLLKRDIPVIVADLDIERNKDKLEKNTARSYNIRRCSYDGTNER